MEKTLWKIWSIEHGAWWYHSQRGYVAQRYKAGVYSYEEALNIVKGANIAMNDTPNEAMVEAIECYTKEHYEKN